MGHYSNLKRIFHCFLKNTIKEAYVFFRNLTKWFNSHTFEDSRVKNLRGQKSQGSKISRGQKSQGSKISGVKNLRGQKSQGSKISKKISNFLTIDILLNKNR